MFTLFVVIIALILSRVCGFDPTLRCYIWVDCYLQKLNQWLGKTPLWGERMGFVSSIIPIIIVTWLISLILCGWFFNLFYFIFGIAVLVYCLGPTDLEKQFGEYKEAHDRGDVEEAKDKVSALLEDNAPTDQSKATRAMSEKFLIQANQRVFAVLFWFIVLGPIGAVLYRFSVIMKKIGERDDGDLSVLASPAQWFQALLDWIPARILTLVFVLAGDFNRGFSIWREYFFRDLDSSYLLIKECGLNALAVTKRAKEGPDEGAHVLEFISRTLWMWMIIYAVVVIAIWLF